MTPSIYMDGRTLHGTGWIRPEDWEEADLALGLLPCWKGSSPSELPELGPPTDTPDDTIPPIRRVLGGPPKGA